MKQLLHIPPLWHPFLLSRILAGNASLILHMTSAGSGAWHSRS